MKKLRIFVLLAISVLAACSSIDEPTFDELKQYLTKQLPEYIRLDTFTIDASDNTGSKVDPLWNYRFRASIVSKEALFRPDANPDPRRYKGVTFVSTTTAKGEKKDIFGKIFCELYEGKWNCRTSLDGSPIDNLGKPLTHFSGLVIVKGTKQEQQYYSQVRQKEDLLRRAKSETKTLFQATIANPRSNVSITDSHFHYRGKKVWFGDIEYIKRLDKKVGEYIYSAILFKCWQNRGRCYALGQAGGYAGRANGIHMVNEKDKRDQIYEELSEALRSWSKKYPELSTPTIN